jgi:integrase
LLPRIRFHDLRHTFATTALTAGIQPRVVSDILGRATVAFTLDTYGHILPRADRHAIETVAAMFRR